MTDDDRDKVFEQWADEEYAEYAEQRLREAQAEPRGRIVPVGPKPNLFAFHGAWECHSVVRIGDAGVHLRGRAATREQAFTQWAWRRAYITIKVRHA